MSIQDHKLTFSAKKTEKFQFLYLTHLFLTSNPDIQSAKAHPSRAYHVAGIRWYAYIVWSLLFESDQYYYIALLV